MSWAQCTGCEKTFSSDTGFDKHRVGRHEYTFAEGMRFDPPVEDGRRCLDEDELVESGMTVNEKGWWVLPRKGAGPESRKVVA